MGDQNTIDQNTDNKQIVCKTAFDPIIRGLILSGMFLGFAIWSIYEIVHEKYPKGSGTYYFTWAVAIAGVPVGLFFLVKILLKAARKLSADDNSIGFSGSDQIKWSSITKIVIRSKGLMDLHHENGVLTLDSWELQNFEDLASFVEAKTEGVEVEKLPEKK